MQKAIFPNGLTVLYEPKKNNAVVVEIMIKTGSNHERPEERGVSHFLEHILFEGTPRRPTNKAISHEIERIGGEFNAYTTNERTCFFVRVLRKHFLIAVDVLADIMHHSLLREKDILREKNVITKEIDMVLDEPRFYQWILLQKTLFQRHPCRFPTYGTKESIRDMTREKIVAFFKKYYVPNNMVISIVGEAPGWRKAIQKAFASLRSPLPKVTFQPEALASAPLTARERRNGSSTYLVLGVKTVTKNHPDAYPLELVNTLLGRGQSSRLFTEVRTNLGLAYDVGTQHVAEVSYGYFAMYACVDAKNVGKTKELMIQEVQSLRQISEKELQEAKEAIEGEYLLDVDDGQKLADQLLFWEQAKDAHLLKDFVKRMKAVTRSDMVRVIEKYFKNYATVVVEGK